MTAPLCIIGAGAFGAGLAIAYAKAGHKVTLWSRSGAAEMAYDRTVARLPGRPLPANVTITDTLPDGAEIILLALPTQVLGRFLATHNVRARHLVSCAKGIDRATGLRPTALIEQVMTHGGGQGGKGPSISQLTGPSFAVDIADGLPTALTLACVDDAVGSVLQDALSTPLLRLYRSTDVIGAELGGALKNVVAIAAGATIGGGLGESARAAVIARGFAEMTRVSRAAGGRDETLAGLSGLGDLVLTCGSEKSRNFRFGIALARGETLDPSVTVEGLHTARQLAADQALETPLADAVAAMADGRADFSQMCDTLLNRPLKPE